RRLQVGPAEVRATDRAVDDEAIEGPPVLPVGPGHNHRHHLLLGSAGGFARPGKVYPRAREGTHEQCDCATSRATSLAGALTCDHERIPPPPQASVGC